MSANEGSFVVARAVKLAHKLFKRKIILFLLVELFFQSAFNLRKRVLSENDRESTLNTECIN